MTITWNNGLPFISIEITTSSHTLNLKNVLLDTGAASFIFNVDKIFEQGMTIEQSDTICKMVGIGGADILKSMSAIINFGENTLHTKSP